MSDRMTEPSERKELCGAQHEARVFTHYAYGDPLPVYARFVGEDSNDAGESEALIIYVTCQREADHAGRHLAYKFGAWRQGFNDGLERAALLISRLAPSVPEPPNDAERSVIREFEFTATPTGMNVTPIVGRGLVTRCIFDGAHLGTWNIEGDGMTFTFNDSLSSAPTGRETELYEIIERFGPMLDENDISDLSRMCREYANVVYESRKISEATIAEIEGRSAPTGLTAKEKIDALIDGAQSLFAEAFECKHSYSEPCGSCMNTGINAMDKDEFDFAVAVHDLAAVGRQYRGSAILESSSTPTPETERIND